QGLPLAAPWAKKDAPAGAGGSHVDATMLIYRLSLLAMQLPRPAPPDSNWASTTILALMAGFVAVVLMLMMVRLYKRCPPNKVMVIFGKTGRGAAKCLHGGAAFVFPTLQEVGYLDLQPVLVPLEDATVVSSDNAQLVLTATATVAISTRPGVIENAASRLMGMAPSAIRAQAESILLGTMSSAAGALTCEEILKQRTAFANACRDVAAADLEKLGLEVVDLAIRQVRIKE
ncbi:MAG: flotillin family protein, partial [Planctomycetota bacterium]|nr:flotillin family protein [Planctomycetota bacterium]